ncbi:unnamed protein product [Mytilus coruscus]|uniref:Uncharacterized protein n=1 Tax=Mytilus coruscus TaxID=42192 RepID=A0A6J8E7F6_MYTCO|nr:unnamed protein product [Mytilus coruscus]
MMDPDIENSVKRIVGEEIRKSQNDLLSQMEGMFSIKLREFDHQQKERSELQMNRLQNELSVNDDYKFQRKSCEDQFKFNRKLSVNTNHLTDKSLKDVMNDDSICLLEHECIEQVSSQVTVTSSLITPVVTQLNEKGNDLHGSDVCDLVAFTYASEVGFGGYIVPVVDSICAESVCDSLEILTDCGLELPGNSLNTVVGLKLGRFVTEAVEDSGIG